MNYILIKMPMDEWVWWCEFLNEVLRDPDMDEADIEDLQKVIDALQGAEKATV